LIKEKRLRIFAGPNGSGKSTITRAVSQFKTPEGFLLPLGYYINADEIATLLANNGFSFQERGIKELSEELLFSFAENSGLISDLFSIEDLQKSIVIKDGFLKLSSKENMDRVAQILARYFRQLMIDNGLSHSYETVFSHPSTLLDIQRAKDSGFRVYLYFVATESPEINKARVRQRVGTGGHNVPEKRIEERYYRSLELLYEASQLCDEVWFFDNSKSTFRIVAHFKQINGKKEWDSLNPSDITNWFHKYYLQKVKLT
jgi:predicted ABC-type ATPase